MAWFTADSQSQPLSYQACSQPLALRDCHDVQVACRTFFHHGVAQHWVEQGAAFFGRGQGEAAFNLAQHFHQVLARNLEDRQFANPRQYVLGKNTVDLRQRALSSRLQAQGLELRHDAKTA